jgi:anti-sigma factor RsiW
MNCDQFRMSIAERLDGELEAPQAQEFDGHAKTCQACHTSLQEWQRVAETLRAGWPSVEPPAHGFLLPQPQPRSSWLEATQRWFGYASVALVASSFLLLAIFRPAVHFDRHELALSFGAAGVSSPSKTAASVSEDQVRAMVQAAVHDVMLQQPAMLQTASESGGEEAQRRLNEFAVRLKLMEETQGSLWQRNEEQRMYLESLWSKSQASGPPTPDAPVGQ